VEASKNLEDSTLQGRLSNIGANRPSFLLRRCHSDTEIASFEIPVEDSTDAQQCLKGRAAGNEPRKRLVRVQSRADSFLNRMRQRMERIERLKNTDQQPFKKTFDCKADDSFKIPLPDLRTAMNPVCGKESRKSSTLDGMTNEAAQKEMRLFSMLQVDGHTSNTKTKKNFSPLNNRYVSSDDARYRKNGLKTISKSSVINPSLSWNLPSSKTKSSIDVRMRLHKVGNHHKNATDGSSAKKSDIVNLQCIIN